MISTAFRWLLLALIGAYRTAVSPFLPRACRFYPSCSAYARDAIRVHGPWRGLALAIGRLLRCHPFHAGGFDPVPSRGEADGHAACQPGDPGHPIHASLGRN